MPEGSKAYQMVGKETQNETDDHFSEVDKETRQGKKEESDSETFTDSVSSQGDPQTAEDEKVESPPRVPRQGSKQDASNRGVPVSRARSVMRSLGKTPQNTPKKSTKASNGPSKVTSKNASNKNSTSGEVPSKSSLVSLEGVDDKPLELEEEKEVDILDEASNSSQSVATDEPFSTTENGEQEDKVALDRKIEEMEIRIEKLQEELREVAALEISLYSVVPEHGSSSHKVHTPARRLSRLYIHACKHWTQDKRATVSKNMVSGLVLIAKSCGNDVPRLTFWLSNIVVLREIISQAFGNSCLSSHSTRFTEVNGNAKKGDGKSSTLKWKGSSGKQMSKQGLVNVADDWQETSTLTAALEKAESWIFSRIVESVWWQTLTPKMQSPEDSYTKKTIERRLAPPLGDEHQGSFSIDLWNSAFKDAFQRLCPVRAGGHECGCLPVLARIVMEQCVARLDVAMFNAILRESANEIPTDPVSDPIVDSKVLPIPAGDLSFGSGAQLKNSVGNWTRWLTDAFGIDAHAHKGDHHNSEDDDKNIDTEPKSFRLLNALSDLLMLPKDMLMDRSIREEVCPSIGLALVKRILCNFTPDEFCPDPVPGAVLESLNAQSLVERRLSADSASSFPFTAAAVVYAPPSSADVAQKVADAGQKLQLLKNVSVVQKKGYTSDEELDELDSPLTLVVEKMMASPTVVANGNGKHVEQAGHAGFNARYDLLREVWSM